MIKKLLVILAVLTVTTGAGVAAFRHYDAYRSEQDKLSAQAAKVQADAAAALKAKQDAVQAAFDKKYRELQIQCDAGLYAYQKLSAWQKKQSPQPNCFE